MTPFVIVVNGNWCFPYTRAEVLAFSCAQRCPVVRFRPHRRAGVPEISRRLSSIAAASTGASAF